MSSKNEDREGQGCIVNMSAEEALRIPLETDYEALDAMSDEEITRRAMEDPDNPPMDEEFLSGKWERLRRPKQAVSIRLDPEVIDWFKSQGGAYQTRINNVLAAYVRRQKERRESR